MVPLVPKDVMTIMTTGYKELVSLPAKNSNAVRRLLRITNVAKG
jgi:hypothetical protein